MCRTCLLVVTRCDECDDNLFTDASHVVTNCDENLFTDASHVVTKPVCLTRGYKIQGWQRMTQSGIKMIMRITELTNLNPQLQLSQDPLQPIGWIQQSWLVALQAWWRASSTREGRHMQRTCRNMDKTFQDRQGLRLQELLLLASALSCSWLELMLRWPCSRCSWLELELMLLLASALMLRWPSSPR